ncbi:MAG: aldo/keto reductase [Proteobacteria bacterium]|nr:aldo/keto reductase [Pseudomonadota bacterium]
MGTRPFTQIKEKEVFEILELFFSNGGQYVDTSFFYGYGKVEKMIGKFNRFYQPQAIYISKIGYFTNLEDYKNINKLQEAVQKSMENLFYHPKYILFHEADWDVWWSKTKQLGNLINLKKLNEINYQIYYQFSSFLKSLDILPGISGNNAHIIEELLALNPHLVLLSKQYDLLWRNGKNLISSAKENKFFLCLGAPFHQGWLFKLKNLIKKRPQFKKEIEELIEVITNASYPLDHIALNFLLQSTKNNVVFGVTTKEELLQNIKNSLEVLPEDLIQKLEAINIFSSPMYGPLKILTGVENG